MGKRRLLQNVMERIADYVSKNDGLTRPNVFVRSICGQDPQ